MNKRIAFGLLTLGISLPTLIAAGPSYGLPGYSVNEVKTWIQGHPTLRADSREGLRVHRADIPSRRFTFQASVFPIGGFQRAGNNGIWSSNSRQRSFNIVRREEFTLVDYDQPVTVSRLEDSLRNLYGPDIYADYRRAQAIYSYFSESSTIEGEVRLGNLYAYWVEITPDANGVSTTGKLNVLLAEDVDRLESYLQQQYSSDS
ncbi:hypothetical protein N836_08085 [Leptolyngbya sp. Heron Island J]|uniref:hypothetical protein n=1 Tax=Leptolyngbya sp. Heron Island J TaxID=1385935 RepID=UPI0003B9A72F|nr:hypothetical protein [Leptolyngbya sp. Heron Island J]ESA36292.1 hypothetical protein N836_08085 [Leptolyngbya sp. Heron Island J]